MRLSKRKPFVSIHVTDRAQLSLLNKATLGSLRIYMVPQKGDLGPNPDAAPLV